MSRPRVALIGCGASGMCFLHALATRQQQNGHATNLPYVVCFEQADEPGGCWRAPPPDEREQPHNVACWHDDIWNNVCKEAFEFSDYTFKKHFQGEAAPTFLPRAHLLDYLQKRTESVDPNIFNEKEGKWTSNERLYEVRFTTCVKSVVFDSETQQFEVKSCPRETTDEASTTHHFDYCIWAAGLRGKPRIPRFTLNLLRTGGKVGDKESVSPKLQPTPYTGTVLHSIHCSTKLEEAVRGKRVVLIGDSNSAEELALQSVRYGVEKCYILSRSGLGDCVYMGSWPCEKDPATGKMQPKVEVHLVLPYRIVGDGRTLKCASMQWSVELDGYDFDDQGESKTLRDIDTVIICTGFVPNMDFLSEDLNLHSEQLYSWSWSVPKDFKMKENEFTPEIGDIEPDDELSFSGSILPGVYRTVLMDNPRMMYITDSQSEYPLLQLDAWAWLCLAFVTGELTVPSRAEMEEFNLDRLIEEMNVAYLRWSLDDNYYDALDDLEDPHWSDDYDDPRAIKCNRELLSHYAGALARDFKDGKYPVDFGTYGELNENGEKLVDLGMQNILMRHLMDKSSDEAAWKTYRDVDPSGMRSIYTGQVAIPLPRHWLELEEEDIFPTKG